MVAGDDPVVLLGGVGAVDGADDVPDGAELVVLLEVHVDLDGAGAAEVVGEGQAALPVARGRRGRRGLRGWGRRPCRRAGWRGWRAGSFWLRSVMRLESGRSGVEAMPGVFGVAGVEREELDGAALHGGGGAVGAAGVDVAADVAVVGGVGVDEDAVGAVLLRDVDLDAAEVAAVADDDDLVFDADAEFGELLEVGEGAVVGVDDVGGDVAGGGGAVEGGEDAGVVLEGVAAVELGVDVLGRGAGHELLAVRRRRLR